MYLFIIFCKVILASLTAEAKLAIRTFSNGIVLVAANVEL